MHVFWEIHHPAFLLLRDIQLCRLKILSSISRFLMSTIIRLPEGLAVLVLEHHILSGSSNKNMYINPEATRYEYSYAQQPWLQHTVSFSSVVGRELRAFAKFLHYHCHGWNRNALSYRLTGLNTWSIGSVSIRRCGLNGGSVSLGAGFGALNDDPRSSVSLLLLPAVWM